MSYVIATTDDVVKWYKLDSRLGVRETLDVLDLGQVSQYNDKRSAKAAAKAHGLKTWRYVKI
jgi:hypothetical protein